MTNMLILSLVTLVYCSIVIASKKSGPPVFDLVSLSEGYHGIVSEDETIVDVQPKIRAGPNVCSYKIVGRRHGEAPFMIHERNGMAELVTRRPLNCEQRKNYKFDIAAVSCDGQVSENVTVRVKVNDVNEFAPSFMDVSYVSTVDEGKLYNEILTLRAQDGDCSAKYGDICRFEVLSNDQPFVVDSDGVLRNTEELDYEKSPNHILSVVAYDCGMKRSPPVMVTIKVNRVCHVGWKGIPKQVNYSPGSGRVELFPSASLELCNVQCDVERVQSRLYLSTDHIGKGCDRDTFSVPSQRKLCGASDESIDLLPPPGPGREWTSGLVSDEGTEGDLIYTFAGDSSGVEVPESVLPRDFTNTFTISTWMKHKSHSSDKHMKEHLLCGADDHKMNRHHFALFVRNCKLVLLLRREYTESDLNTFQPAEWRWKLPQVCDDEWHHYSIQATLPSVVLYVDGHLFHPESGESPEVIDDWPLHPTKGIKTKVSIGACWQGSEGAMRHGLTGYLGGLSVLRGSTEDQSVLSCLTRCQESLDTPAMELLQPSMELLTNKVMTQIAIEGDNITNLETLVQKIAYTNSREAPTPGRRPVSLSTKILCGKGKAIKALGSESFVMVEPVIRPAVRLNGTANYGAEYDGFRQGLRVFPDLNIGLSDAAWDQGMNENSVKLDQCSVTLYPPLNFDHEGLDWPTSGSLESSVSRQGATLKGLSSLKEYQEAVRSVKYSNRKPAYYLNRDFKLQCQHGTSNNGRKLESNEYIQRVTVIHPQLTVEKPAPSEAGHLKIDKTQHKPTVLKPAKPAYQQASAHHVGVQNPRIVKTISASNEGHAATLIVVVSVGFAVFLVALAIVRARSVRSRNSQEHADTEMAWDDSALNITVNPMEMGPKETRRLRDDEDDSICDSDDSNYNDSESSDEEETALKPKELEWDHSTLTM